MSSFAITDTRVRPVSTGALRQTLRAEFRRARQGRQPVVLSCCAVLMCLLTSYSLAVAASSATAPPVTAATVVEGQARAWMMSFLFVGLFGSLVFTRDVGTGAITRSVLTASRDAVLLAKVVVATVTGLVFGLAVAALAFLTTYGIDTALGVPFTWTGEATLIVIGVVACCVLATVFGLFVGILTRHATTALIVLLVQTLLLDPGLQRLVPDVAKYLFTIALSSLYRDTLPNLLPLPVAVAVSLAWVLALGLAAAASFRRKDVSAS